MAVASITLTLAFAPSSLKQALAVGFTGQQSQPPAVSLRVDDGPARQERQLTVVSDGKTLAHITVPPRVSARALQQGLKSKLVHPNGYDFAVGFRGDPGSFVVVFLRQSNGAYIATDVSQVERANLGASGLARKYSNVETVPIEWLPRPDDSVQIRLQTRATDESGRRYRPTEPLVITRDGRPLWR